jgi:hypothetical protein
MRIGHGPVVLEMSLSGVRARSATRRERVASHVFGDRLDRELAAGARPEASATLSLRASQLACPASRRMLASTVARLIRSSQEPLATLGPLRSRGLLDRVAAARPELEELIEHLLAPAPVSARGVAIVQLLLTDGTGPLHGHGSSAELGRVLRQATRALQPTADWPA